MSQQFIHEMREKVIAMERISEIQEMLQNSLRAAPRRLVRRGAASQVALRQLSNDHTVPLPIQQRKHNLHRLDRSPKHLWK